MIDLPMRKFELNASVFATVGKYQHHGRVFGCEDGRNLHMFGGPDDGWAYHIQITGNDGQTGTRIVGEEDLVSVTEG